jgi:hypothetical protein
MAGAASRTVVSPLERLKIILCVPSPPRLNRRIDLACAQTSAAAGYHHGKAKSERQGVRRSLGFVVSCSPYPWDEVLMGA